MLMLGSVPVCLGNGYALGPCGASCWRSLGGDSLVKIFQRRYAVPVAIDTMLPGCDAAAYVISPPDVPAQPHGDGDVVLRRIRNRIQNVHPRENRGGMAPTHQAPPDGNDGKFMHEALQRGVSTRPSDAVEVDIALSDGCDETSLAQSRQKHIVVAPGQSKVLEGGVEAFAKHIGQLRTSVVLDEDELRIRHVAGNARENLVVLRKIFEERLTAPISYRSRPQSKTCTIDLRARYIGCVVIYREVW